MPRTTASLQAEVTRLNAENKRLRRENSELKKQPTPSSRAHLPGLSFWRKLGMFVCITLVGALLVAGNVLFWAGRSLVDQQRYMNTVGPLIAQPSIQAAVADYATNQLYQNVDVEQYTAQALPEKVSFLAPALSTQIKAYTEKTIQGLLASQKFQNLWITVNQTAHQKIISFVTNYQGDGTISLNDIYQQISQDLAGTNLSFLSGKTLPAKVGSITVVQADWLPTAHRVVTRLDTWRNLAVVTVLLLSAVAVYLARNRRRVVMGLGIMTTVLMSLWLVALQVIKSMIVDKVNPAYQTAAGDAVNIIMHSLQVQTITIGLLGALVAGVGWLTGPYKSAAWVQRSVQDVFAGRLHALIFKKEFAVTTWLGRYKRALQWAVVALAGLMAVFTHNVSPKGVVLGAGMTAIIVLVLEVLGAPVTKRR